MTRSWGGRLVRAPLTTMLSRAFALQQSFDRRQNFLVKREARLRIERLFVVKIEPGAQGRDGLGDSPPW